ncbi:hypothetical protein WICMUC_005550 [Wickerhamomyces mucosus]|uniref:non-specific serine/threonine protein kinase n=1 Tax=Wickerhamomyces mucosus TaxID=1378264 RepID=A0A9P8T5C3_9ASCO|nr:hypothetical protein WICMUC_005550 [Wickerhamomyces mucosus]
MMDPFIKSVIVTDGNLRLGVDIFQVSRYYLSMKCLEDYIEINQDNNPDYYFKELFEMLKISKDNLSKLLDDLVENFKQDLIKYNNDCNNIKNLPKLKGYLNDQVPKRDFLPYYIKNYNSNELFPILNNKVLNIEEFIKFKYGRSVILRNKGSLIQRKKKSFQSIKEEEEYILEIFDVVRLASGEIITLRGEDFDRQLSFKESFDICFNKYLPHEYIALETLNKFANKNVKIVPKLNGIFFLKVDKSILTSFERIDIYDDKFQLVQPLSGIGIEMEKILEIYEIPIDINRLRTRFDLKIKQYFEKLIKICKNNLLLIHRHYGLHGDLSFNNIIIDKNNVIFIDFAQSWSYKCNDRIDEDEFLNLKKLMVKEFKELIKIMIYKLEDGFKILSQNINLDFNSDYIDYGKFENIKQLVENIIDINEIYFDLSLKELKQWCFDIYNSG